MKWYWTAIFLLALLIGGFSCTMDKAEGEPFADDEAVWRDPATGLVWEKVPTSGYVNWMDANDFCQHLSLGGYNDWRLPTINELRSLIVGCDGSARGGSCGVNNNCSNSWCQNEECYSCFHGDGPSNGCFGTTDLPGACNYYWSSSNVPDQEDRAWAVGFTSGFVYKPRVFYAFHARCVR
ncbi:MAG TPA: DUF1566 domain-containing protein [bacterium]|nr:DUF1566 domain-containing protein [bacterium]